MSKISSFRDFTKRALSKIKSTWSKIRAKIKSAILTRLKKVDPGQEVTVKLPAAGSDNLVTEARSGDVEAIKGNYNEALLLQMIYETKDPTIQISDKYKKNKSSIDQKVKQWSNALKNSSGGEKAKPVIIQGTKAMLQYLIQTTKQADSIIIGGYLDNLSFLDGGIGTKGDIGLHIMKEGKEELQDFSLKLYSTKSVGLANTSAGGLAGHLVGPQGKSEVDKIIEKDEELQVLMKAANTLDRTKNALKDYNSNNEKKKQSGLNRLTKYGFKPSQIKKLDINKLRDQRQIARTDINPRLAEIAFDVITKFQKKNPKKFNENLLEILGFNDHDTKILMAVTTKKGSVIIDRHPELDLNNIKLVKTGVSIKVVGPTGKTVVTFGFKEGEKKAVTGKISYANVPIFQAESKSKLKTFTSLNEVSKSGKNVHMTHIEDQVLYGGVKGARQAIFALRSMRDMLAGDTNKGRNVTVKWDGAPAVFAGVDPSDNQFFVAKKGIFNKDPKVYKSHEDIDADTSGDLSDKLKVAFDELKDIGIKGVVQGDIMFTKKDLKVTNINGVKHVTFQPNTIVYAVPVNSELGKKIGKSKLGVIFHTTYSGNDFESMKASFDVNVSKFKNKSSVWYDDATLKDMSGTATLTKAETQQVTDSISKAGKIFQKISSTTLKQIETDPTLAQEIETFNNTFVRRGEKIRNSKSHVQNLIRYFGDKYDKEISKRKSPVGRRAQQDKKEERLKFFSTENSKNLELVFELQMAIVSAKELIISKLDELKQLDTFVLTKNGFKVTGQEGYVAIDDAGGSVLKLVDRLEFSYNNFSPEIIKGWQR